LAGVILDLVGEVDDQVGPLYQIGPPNRIGMERCWNAGEPRQRTRVDALGRGEPPVEDGGHVTGSVEVSSGGGCLQVQERVLPRFGR
jgi:hypothetical protein